jgi:CubicO group peptidase (beta-lactamase class C family)
MAKFGYLYLNGGVWDGKAILPEWYVRESTRKHSEGGNPEPAEYGYLWWVIPERWHPGYYAAGYGAQYIFVIPDRDLIIVTTGDHTLVPPPQEPVPLFFQHIIPAAGALGSAEG